MTNKLSSRNRLSKAVGRTTSKTTEETTKARAGTEIKTRSHKGSIAYSMGKTKDISLGIAQMPKKLKKG